MSDFGGGFTSLRLEEKLKELGICVQRSVPHMPQQNGRAEHFNQTLFEKLEAMRHQACLGPGGNSVLNTVSMYTTEPLLNASNLKLPMRL